MKIKEKNFGLSEIYSISLDFVNFAVSVVAIYFATTFFCNIKFAAYICQNFKNISIMGIYSDVLRYEDDATGYNGLGMASNQVEHWDIADRLTMRLKRIFRHPNARVGMELPSEFGKEHGYYIYDVGIQADGNNLFAVELCHNDNFDKSVKRIKGSFKKYKTFQEGFIFNYETSQWYKVDKNGNTDIGNSYSNFLQVDLNTLI